MTKDRLDWILSGVNRSKLNKFEKDFMKQIERSLNEVSHDTRRGVWNKFTEKKVDDRNKIARGTYSSGSLGMGPKHSPWD